MESLRSTLLACVISSKFIDIAFKTEALLTETCIFSCHLLIIDKNIPLSFFHVRLYVLTLHEELLNMDNTMSEAPMNVMLTPPLSKISHLSSIECRNRVVLSWWHALHGNQSESKRTIWRSSLLYFFLQMVLLRGHDNEMDFKLFNKFLVPDQG
jgi:hypothetical protein